MTDWQRTAPGFSLCIDANGQQVRVPQARRPANVGDAARLARNLLTCTSGPIGNPVSVPLRQPVKVNEPSPMVAREAAVQRRWNRTFLTAELARLPMAQAQQVQQMLAAIGQTGDERAALALETLLFEGKLTSTDEGIDLATELAMLANTASTRNDMGLLLGDVVQEILDPFAMSQLGRGTCAATAPVMQLVAERPGLYVRLVRQLLGSRGVATLPDGDRLTRVPNTDWPDGTGRTISQQLLYAALMDYGDADWQYDNALDGHYRFDTSTNEKLWRGDMNVPTTGLHASEAARIESALLGRWYEMRDIPDLSEPYRSQEVEKVISEIRGHLGDGQWVPISVDPRNLENPRIAGAPAHRLLVVAMGMHELVLVNPHGIEERMPLSELHVRLMGASIPTMHSTATVSTVAP